MKVEDIIIKPIKSLYKISNFIRVISFLFLILIACGLMTDGYFFILILQFLIFLVVHIYETIKVIHLRNEVYILRGVKLITDKDIIDCQNTKHELDKQGNIIFFINNKKIKINRLSYNFDVLLSLVNGDDNFVYKKDIIK